MFCDARLNRGFGGRVRLFYFIFFILRFVFALDRPGYNRGCGPTRQARVNLLLKTIFLKNGKRGRIAAG